MIASDLMTQNPLTVRVRVLAVGPRANESCSVPASSSRRQRAGLVGIITGADMPLCFSSMAEVTPTASPRLNAEGITEEAASVFSNRNDTHCVQKWAEYLL